MSNHFDFLVLGGGSAGYAAARTARQYKERVAIVDGARELGGLCILRGCMPSKTLIYSAEVLHLAKMSKRFGLDIPNADVDMKALHQRKLATIDEFAKYRQEQLQSDRFHLFRSHGRFCGEKEIELDDGTRLTAERILIATGSTVNIPSVPGLAEVPFWTSDDILDLDFRPESVLLLGGGIVACELAQFLQRIGTQVIQVQRSPRILRETSAQSAAVVEEVFRREGIELITDTQLEQVSQTASGFQARFTHKGETLAREAPHIFNALGRRALTHNLNLSAAGVQTQPNGHICTNQFQQTENPAIYAAGDCAGPHEIVHVAILQGETAARHALGMPAEPVHFEHLTGIIFTDPQVGFVGIPVDELEGLGEDYVVADYPFDDHGKSILMEATDGYVKVWARKPDGTIIAAECVHREASELIHPLAVAVSLGATVKDLLKTHWYHPTLSEIWSYPLEDCAEKLGL